MTSLQYGWLLFAKGCSFCDRKNAGKADATFRARICTACIKTKYASHSLLCPRTRRSHPSSPSRFAARNTAAGNAAIWKATNQKLHPLVIYCCTPTSGAFLISPTLMVGSDWWYSVQALAADPSSTFLSSLAFVSSFLCLTSSTNSRTDALLAYSSTPSSSRSMERAFSTGRTRTSSR